MAAFNREDDYDRHSPPQYAKSTVTASAQSEYLMPASHGSKSASQASDTHQLTAPKIISQRTG
jgi:hypothetical protein